eukprot:359416-Chlamydomonas_euryale.AAC.21
MAVYNGVNPVANMHERQAGLLPRVPVLLVALLDQPSRQPITYMLSCMNMLCIALADCMAMCDVLAGCMAMCDVLAGCMAMCDVLAGCMAMCDVLAGCITMCDFAWLTA